MLQLASELNLIPKNSEKRSFFRAAVLRKERDPALCPYIARVVETADFFSKHVKFLKSLYHN